MNLVIDGLAQSSAVSETLSAFGKPLSQSNLESLRDSGFLLLRGHSVNCMTWLWMQWLQSGSIKQIKHNVRVFIDRSLEMKSISSHAYFRAYADLFLLHCAIFGATTKQLRLVAESVLDVSESALPTIGQNEDIYAMAWCGMLKYYILNDVRKAEQQYELIWGAYRPPFLSAATKPLVTPWLKGNWPAFVKEQEKDFKKLWERGRKDGTVLSESRAETVVTVDRYPIQQKWCWSHCGLALLAYRNGVKVATDEFWFPSYSLKCIDQLSGE